MNITERIKHLVHKPPTAYDVNIELFLVKTVFRKIIDRERDRANRTGEIFSLVVYLLSDESKKQEALHLLADTLLSSMRSIDAAGWLDLRHIGVLLPETDAEGAHRFAKKITQETHSSQLLPDYEIFTYPSEALSNPEKISLQGESSRSVSAASQRNAWSITHSECKVDYFFCLTKRFLKRGFDILGAATCLLILSPLFLLIAVFIKIVSPGPVLFKQQRVGYGGHPFTFLKFRTMRQGSDSSEHQAYLVTLINGDSDKKNSDKPMTKLDDDPQIIPLGNLLRKSCLDELPQLINVLCGDMSLVGPRPPIPYEVKEYHAWHRGRFNATPGMTGLWQVSGKNRLSFREMVRLDIRYARDRSLWMDIKILFRTPLAILEQLKGNSKNVNSTLSKGF
jgi:lipopolysaccharide/colanic/teichoic acid biosynthesis glycosyltransferase